MRLLLLTGCCCGNKWLHFTLLLVSVNSGHWTVISWICHNVPQNVKQTIPGGFPVSWLSWQNPSNHKFTALYPQQSTHPQFYLQSSNGHHATGNVWRESVLLVTESPVNPQTASEAKMDAPIHTATVKDGDKGFYITLHSCLKPAQKHTIRPEWTDPLFPSWHYCYMRFIEETWTSPYFQLTLKWTMVGSKNPESTKKKKQFFYFIIIIY